MPSYYVRSVWYIGAPPERVWAPLSEVENWAHWWPEVTSAMELETGFGEGHGSLKRCTWRGSIAPEFIFNLRVTRIAPESLLEAEVRGRLEGTTRWIVTPQEGGSAICMEWSFRTHIWWMGLLGPLTRRLYPHIFESILKSGGISLADHLAVPWLPAKKVHRTKKNLLG